MKRTMIKCLTCNSILGMKTIIDHLGHRLMDYDIT